MLYDPNSKVVLLVMAVMVFLLDLIVERIATIQISVLDHEKEIK